MSTTKPSIDKPREITIETLSTPPLDIPPAPLPRRLLASIVDSIFIGSIWLGTISIVSGNHPTNQWSSIRVLLLLFFVIAYYTATEWLLGASFGKLLLRLRVLGMDGDPCTLNSSIIRNTVRLIDWLPAFYLVGAGLIFSSLKRGRAGDRLAKTIVTVAASKDSNPPPAPFLYH